jgi:TM2 domain-containing membrane protein YozV
MSEEREKSVDEMYCKSCGAIIKKDAEICVHCGVRQKSAGWTPGGSEGGGKDWLTTLLLCIFLGGIGIHRFYTGHIGIGIAQVLTLGGCGIWALVDLIMIAMGTFKDANGNLLVRN